MITGAVGAAGFGSEKSRFTMGAISAGIFMSIAAIGEPCREMAAGGVPDSIFAFSSPSSWIRLLISVRKPSVTLASFSMVAFSWSVFTRHRQARPARLANMRNSANPKSCSLAEKVAISQMTTRTIISMALLRMVREGNAMTILERERWLGLQNFT